VPIMFNRLLKLPDAVKRKYDLSSLKFIVHAAAPVSPSVKREMIEWWGPVINEYYGSTETGMVVFCTSEEWLAHPGTVGRAIPEADVRVIDAEGQALPAGEIGEVLARVKTIADFTYQGDDQKRHDSEKAGLIAPGDIGYFDAEGFLYLCDRAKDMVISGTRSVKSTCAPICEEKLRDTRFRSGSTLRTSCHARIPARFSSANCASPIGRAGKSGSIRIAFYSGRFTTTGGTRTAASPNAGPSCSVR